MGENVNLNGNKWIDKVWWERLGEVLTSDGDGASFDVGFDVCEVLAVVLG